MEVHYGFDNIPAIKNPVITMGSYDGVHTGHRQLLYRIMDIAAHRNGESVVLTFSPHPRTVLEKNTEVKLLSSLEEKITLLENTGIDHLIVIPFDKAFSMVPPYDFVKEYLIGKIGVSTLVIGYNHHFGHNREGNFDFLDRLENEFGFEVYMTPAHEIDHNKVSSTVIRQLIAEGQMNRASELLGYHYFMYAAMNRDETGQNKVTPLEPLKLLPPAGEYGVMVKSESGNFESRLIIERNGAMFLNSNEMKCGYEKINIIFT